MIYNILINPETIQKQYVYYGYPFAGYIYDFFPTLVKCRFCEKEFNHNKLKYGYTYLYVSNICPYCLKGWCCDLKYESIEEYFSRIKNQTLKEYNDSVTLNAKAETDNTAGLSS